MFDKVVVSSLPTCTFCDKQANYDAKTNLGPWANMCNYHFKIYGIGLGTGKGQRLELKK